MVIRVFGAAWIIKDTAGVPLEGAVSVQVDGVRSMGGNGIGKMVDSLSLSVDVFVAGNAGSWHAVGVVAVSWKM